MMEIFAIFVPRACLPPVSGRAIDRADPGEAEKRLKIDTGLVVIEEIGIEVELAVTARVGGVERGSAGVSIVPRIGKKLGWAAESCRS